MDAETSVEVYQNSSEKTDVAFSNKNQRYNGNIFPFFSFLSLSELKEKENSRLNKKYKRQR